MTTYTQTARTLGRDVVSRIITERTETTSGLAIWYRGAVITEHGIVNVLYSEPPRGSHSGTTLLEFVHNDELHQRRWDRQFQPRHLARLARKFAQDVTEKVRP